MPPATTNQTTSGFCGSTAMAFSPADAMGAPGIQLRPPSLLIMRFVRNVVAYATLGCEGAMAKPVGLVEPPGSLGDGMLSRFQVAPPSSLRISSELTRT